MLVLANDSLWPPGTLFLWMFWPSFNFALLKTPTEMKNAVFNTYYALAVSAVTAISVSALAHPQGKINMVRRGAAPWAAPGSSRPNTHLHVPSPQHQSHGVGKSTASCGALSAMPWSRRERARLLKRALELRRLRNDQGLTGGTDFAHQRWHQTDPSLNAFLLVTKASHHEQGSAEKN